MAVTKARYVINRETGEVYPFRARLLERAEFAPFYDDPPPIDRTTGLCIQRDKPDPLLAAVEEKKKTAEQADSDMRVKMLVAAMQGMVKMDFATNNGMPTLTRLEKAVSFPPSKEEREVAFAEYQKLKEAAGQ